MFAINTLGKGRLAENKLMSNYLAEPPELE